ncbi:HVA1 family protein [Ilumatobacter sp.]|uniref:HVA1 family protein n=1 Tax=Ilumatobacter sp. TaxID=1967498 RepID=UPI003751D91D
MRMLEKCPSGRLPNVFDGTVIEPSLPTEINAIPGGPLWAAGGMSITDEAGHPLEERNRFSLCRCGASENKPLCDGNHSRQSRRGRPMSSNSFQVGDTVEWNWGNGTGTGDIVKQFTAKVTRTLAGSEIARNATDDDPAFLIEQEDGDRFLKFQSELSRT